MPGTNTSTRLRARLWPAQWWSISSQRAARPFCRVVWRTAVSPAIDDFAVSRYQASCPSAAASAVAPYDVSRFTLISWVPPGEAQLLWMAFRLVRVQPSGTAKATVRPASRTRCHPSGTAGGGDDRGSGEPCDSDDSCDSGDP